MDNGFQFMVIGNGYKRTKKDSLTFPQYDSGKFTVTVKYMLIFLGYRIQGNTVVGSYTLPPVIKESDRSINIKKHM